MAYSATPTISGTTGPYTWSVTNGTLPTGLSINATTGAIRATHRDRPVLLHPVATDALGGTATQSETVDVVGRSQPSACRQ